MRQRAVTPRVMALLRAARLAWPRRGAGADGSGEGRSAGAGCADVVAGRVGAQRPRPGLLREMRVRRCRRTHILIWYRSPNRSGDDVDTVMHGPIDMKTAKCLCVMVLLAVCAQAQPAKLRIDADRLMSTVTLLADP